MDTVFFVESDKNIVTGEYPYSLCCAFVMNVVGNFMKEQLMRLRNKVRTSLELENRIP